MAPVSPSHTEYPSQQLTVLIFKDNLAARAFHVKKKWIVLFRWLVPLMIVFCLACLISSYLIYRKAMRPSVDFLEEPEESTETPSSSSSDVQPFFSAFPSNYSTTFQQPSGARTPSISLENLKTSWKDHSLRVDFSIRNALAQASTPRSQQGRILILARGVSSLWVYPRIALNPTGQEALLEPQKGESFSVSRFREVHAEFGPFATTGELKKIEIYLFDKKGELLIYQTVDPA